MLYQCPKCQEVYLEDELTYEDLGSHEDYMGVSVWCPCLVYSTPCCGVEPEYKEEEDEDQEA